MRQATTLEVRAVINDILQKNGVKPQYTYTEAGRKEGEAYVAYCFWRGKVDSIAEACTNALKNLGYSNTVRASRTAGADYLRTTATRP